MSVPEPRPLSNLTNPLATVEQLSSSGSQLDGLSPELEASILFAGARLTQFAGVLLRLPQDIVASSIVIFQRFFLGPEGGSLRDHGVLEISAAATYLTAKTSALPKSPRSVLNAYAVLAALSSNMPSLSDGAALEKLRYDDARLSEGAYQAQRQRLMKHETLILRTIGFQTHVSLPYALCINYLQAMDVFGPATGDGDDNEDDDGKTVSRRAFAHLNSALLSPQRLYLTHQPSALATAAIYLAAREVGVKLPGNEWWEVFDCDREELGFLVVAMLSMDGFVREEARKWEAASVPMTVAELAVQLATLDGS